MGRTKSPVFNTRAAPKPVEAAQASESMETPSGSFSSTANSSTCPNCGSTFPDMSATDFHDHVASCTRPSTAGTGTSESTLSPPPDSPNFDPASTIAVQDPDNVDDYRSVIDFGDVVDDEPNAKQNVGATDQVTKVTNIDNSQQKNGGENDSKDAFTPKFIRQEDKDGLEKITIAPYNDREFDQYEYEVVQKEDEKKDEPETDLKEEDSQEISNDPEDPKVSDDLKVIDDQEALEDPVTPDNGEVGDEIEATEVMEENLYRADTPTALEATTESNVDDAEVLRASTALTNALLNTSAVSGALEVPAESKIDGADIPRASQVTLESENRVDSEVASQIAADAEDKPEKVTFKFKKFTPITAFEDFLKDAENMSYEELYHRTSIISDVLLTYQNEYDDVSRKLTNYESRKAYEKQIADEKKKAKEDQKKIDEKEAVLAEDRKLLMLQSAFDEKLKLRGDKWVAFVEKFEAMNGDRQDVDRLKKLHEGAFAAALLKRQRAAEKEAQPKVALVRGDLPPLSKRDLEPHWKKRKIIQDRVAFDEKKQADVYVQKYNSKMSGNQNLIDRNALDGVDDELNENGRPKRSTTKRAFYDTEQSETPPDTEPENLPAKRARTKRILDDGIPSPGRPQTFFESRDGTPARVFPSGKRVGRPPGSKTKNPATKATQSKLNTVQVASPSESEVEEDEVQNNEVESRAQELEPAQEEQLHAAATSLVAQTVEANAAAGGPVKKKHAGGRPKKKVAVEEPVGDQSDVPFEDVPILPKPRNKGGRPRKHPIAAGGVKASRGGRFKKEPINEGTSVQVGEEDEVIQSTEHDNESLFPSTSTSRPTTSSSGGTDATFGARQTRRTATRAKSQAQGANDQNLEDPLDAPGASVSTNGRGKRSKRNFTENIQTMEPAESGGDSEGENIVVDTYRPDLEEVDPVPPRKRKAVRGKKGRAIAQSKVNPQEATPEKTGEASNNLTGRPKRKRNPALPESSIDPDLLGDYLSDDDGETPPPSKRRRPRGGRKGKSFKREETTDADSVDGDSSVPPSRKRAARAVTKRNSIKQEMLDEGASDDNSVPSPSKIRKSRTNNLIVADGDSIEAGADGGFETDNGERPPSSARKKRVAGSSTQGNGVEDIEVGGDGSASKKRKARAISKSKGVSLGESIEPEFATLDDEGAEPQNGDEDEVFELGGHGEADTESAPPAKKRKTRAVKGKAPKTESTGETEIDSEDYTGMDPAEAELLRKKKRKSRKLAAATRQRWANGTMKGPMEKRKATNAAKKAARLAAKVAGGAGSAGPTGDVPGPVAADGTLAVGEFAQGGVIHGVAGVPVADPKIAAGQFMGGGIGGGQIVDGIAGPSFSGPSNAAPIQAAPSTAKKPPFTKPKIAPLPLQLAPTPVLAPAPAPSRTSNRVRKPTSRVLGLDGAADDEDDEADEQFRNEYDRYQSSPKGSGLAKRVRKSFHDFSALGDDEDSY